MTKAILLALSVASVMPGATLTVCASGCNHATVQAAVNAAASGDTLILAAGETFGENVAIAAKSLTITTSAASLLPPSGWRAPGRVSPLYATIRTPNSSPALVVGYVPAVLTTENTSTDTLTLSLGSALPENSPVVGYERVRYGTFLPGGVSALLKYYIKGISGSSGSVTTQLSTVPGGAAVDITSAHTQPYSTVEFAPAENRITVTVRGIRFAGASTGGLVQVGNNRLNLRAAGPSFRCHQCIADGSDGSADGLPTTWAGPRDGFQLFDGHDHEITDSVIYGMHRDGGQPESIGISVTNSDNVIIARNYISSSGIGIIAGGSLNAERRPSRRLVVTGNYITKEPWMFYNAATGAPTRACLYVPSGNGRPVASGEFYRRLDVSASSCSTANACYVCQSNGTWASSTAPAFIASRPAVKVLFELKGCDECIIEGNFMEYTRLTLDSGMGWGPSSSPLCEGDDNGNTDPLMEFSSRVTYRYNHFNWVWAGFMLRTSNYGNCNYATNPWPTFANLIQDNLTTNIGGEWPKSCEIAVYGGNNVDCSRYTDGLQQFGYGISTGFQGRIGNNTIRGPARYAILFSLSGRSNNAGSSVVTEVPNWGLEFSNNITESTGETVEAGTTYVVHGFGADCTSGGWGGMGPSRVRNSVFRSASTSSIDFNSDTGCGTYAANIIHNNTAPGFAGSMTGDARDSALTAGSPYSKANGSPTLLGEDGESLGADALAIAERTLPAIYGEPSMATQLGLKVARSGGTVTITAATRGASCTATLYSDRSRVTQTQSAANTTGAWTFNSEGTAGSRYYHVACANLGTQRWTGGLWAVGQI